MITFDNNENLVSLDLVSLFLSELPLPPHGLGHHSTTAGSILAMS